MTKYEPSVIEPKWQKIWQERGVFRARPYAGRKYYVYNPAPYVTGNLHMGHVRNYTYGDFLSKIKRLHGENVLYTIGFDAFGVPTETAAIRERVSPVVWTARCIDTMKRQMGRMGFGFDWERSFCTSDPDYYRWTQWIFVEMFREGLIYEREGESLWCLECGMALARSLAEAGRCLFCGGDVESRRTAQWYLRITPYLDRLLAELDEVRDHNGQARAGQECLLSRKQVWAVRLEIPETAREIEACLESPGDWSKDLVLAVHPEDWGARSVLGLQESPGAMGSETRAADTAGVRRPSGILAIEPQTRRVFEVVIDAELDPLYVDQPVLRPAGAPLADPTDWTPPAGGFQPRIVYAQKDFSISRQRLWGTPIPIVRCPACGPVTVRLEDLPVLLPEIELDAAGRLRRRGEEGGLRDCPACGRAAPLDSQVMDCHFDSLWHYCRPCVPDGAELPFDSDELRYWMPVDQIQFGRDTIPFLLTMRLFTKFLRDRGTLTCSEFAKETLAHGLILKDNRKMSKHIGNVVDPMSSVDVFGADSLRFCVLAKAEPKSDYPWSDNSVAQYLELLRSYHDDLCEHACAAEKAPSAPADPKARKHARVFLVKALREVSILESSVARGRLDIYGRAIARLLVALHVFKERYYERAGSRAQAAWGRCQELSVPYLAPIAPHLAEECWERLGRRGSIFEGAHWPLEGESELRSLLEAVGEEAGGESPVRVRPVA